MWTSYIDKSSRWKKYFFYDLIDFLRRSIVLKVVSISSTTPVSYLSVVFAERTYEFIGQMDDLCGTHMLVTALVGKRFNVSKGIKNLATES